MYVNCAVDNLAKTCVPLYDHAKTSTLDPLVSVSQSILGHHTQKVVKASFTNIVTVCVGKTASWTHCVCGSYCLTAPVASCCNSGWYGKTCEKTLCYLWCVRHWGVTNSMGETKVAQRSTRLRRPVIVHLHKTTVLVHTYTWRQFASTFVKHSAATDHHRPSQSVTLCHRPWQSVAGCCRPSQVVWDCQRTSQPVTEHEILSSGIRPHHRLSRITTSCQRPSQGFKVCHR